MTDIWIRDLAGNKALVDDADRWTPHGWSVTLAPVAGESVWMSHPDVSAPGLIPWGARAYWEGIGWAPSAPPEPYNPTRDPVLVDVDPVDTPPDGTVAEVTEWVGSDRARAEAALVAEQRRETPRTTLVDTLQKVGQGDATQTSAAPAAPSKEA